MTASVHWHTTAPGIRVVTLDGPKRNALNPALLEEVNAALDAADSDDVAVLLLTSAVDGIFVAGADVTHMASLDTEAFTRFGRSVRQVNERLSNSAWLSVAVLDGATLGGGLELALACTMRVAGARARLGLPEVRLGLIPGGGGTQRLPRLIGRGRALDLILTGRSVSGREARDLGLVDRLSDDQPLGVALALAAELAQASRSAQRAALRAVDASWLTTLGAGLKIEEHESAQLFTEGDAAEGLAAFIEKRAPNFARVRVSTNDKETQI